MSLVHPPDEADALIPKNEACVRLATSESTLMRLVKSGALPAYRIGKNVRFRVSDLEAFLARSREGMK